VGHLEHRADAPRRARCWVLTISDTRTAATDTSGAAIAALLESHGHTVTGRRIVGDEPGEVAALVREQLAGGEAQAIITTGGTGISSRDRTYEAICGLLERRLDGFGELFRMLSYHEIGAAAMLSRAVAGISGRTIVFALPGSEAAVRLALTKLILPELGHLIREAGR
jgi:molybdenum cofactor biosynthesis protein B